mmetsp:Transcript_522/g.1227  ORF Transcript_522/g.1227 Transcript_522/m.1227 type:complete len:269 (+) Transcript_522:127-933(+)
MLSQACSRAIRCHLTTSSLGAPRYMPPLATWASQHVDAASSTSRPARLFGLVPRAPMPHRSSCVHPQMRRPWPAARRWCNRQGRHSSDNAARRRQTVSWSRTQCKGTSGRKGSKGAWRWSLGAPGSPSKRRAAHLPSAGTAVARWPRSRTLRRRRRGHRSRCRRCRRRHHCRHWHCRRQRLERCGGHQGGGNCVTTSSSCGFHGEAPPALHAPSPHLSRPRRGRLLPRRCHQRAIAEQRRFQHPCICHLRSANSRLLLLRLPRLSAPC